MKFFFGLAVGLPALSAYVTVFANETKDGWQNEITIYGWLAAIDGTLNYPAEGTGEGTMLNPLEHFLNIDDLLILRPVNRTKKIRKRLCSGPSGSWARSMISISMSKQPTSLSARSWCISPIQESSGPPTA